MKYLIPFVLVVFMNCGQAPQTIPSLTKDSPYAEGERIYLKRCVSCHQRDGSGKLRGHEFAANFTAADGVLKRSDDELRQAILNGYEGKYGRMPAFKPILDENEINSVLGYIRHVFGKAKPEASEAEANTSPETPDKTEE